MDWGLELWDQFDSVDKHLQHDIDFGEKYAKFVKERCSIEMEYASKLRKLVKSFQPKKRDEDRSMFSTHKAFQSQLSEVNDIAGQHELVAEEMMTNVSRAAQNFFNDLKLEKKKLYHDGRHLQSELDQHERILEQTKKKFEKEWKECERAQAYYEKLDSDGNFTKADVEKAKQVWMSKKDSVEGCKTDYGAYLHQFNTEQTAHYQTQMPKIFESYRVNDEKGIQKFKELMVEYAKIEKKVKPIIQKCLDGMEQAANAIDAKLDAQLVVEKLKSGFIHPTDKEFEDYTSPQQNRISDEGADNSQKTSLGGGRTQNRKSGLSWLFGQKKPGPVNFLRKQLSGEKSVSQSNNLPEDENSLENIEQAVDGQNKDSDIEKSRTLSVSTKRRSYINIDINEPKLTADKRSASVDLLQEQKTKTLPVKQEKNIRERSKSDLRISASKKKLKSVFRLSKTPSNFPKVEVSGPVSCDVTGTVCTDDYLEAIPSSPLSPPSKISNHENVYDEVAGEPAVPESADYSHLPPEQRRKKLQKQIDELKKELSKEDDGRKAMVKMQDVYRSNPALGDATSLEAQIKQATMKMEKLQVDLNQFEAWYADASGSVQSSSPSRHTIRSNEQQPVQQPVKSEPAVESSLPRDQSFGDDFDEEIEPIGTCVALYDFEATSEGALSMKTGQEFSVLEADNGDGWTRAMTGDVDGYVPTSYIEVKLFS